MTSSIYFFAWKSSYSGILKFVKSLVWHDYLQSLLSIATREGYSPPPQNLNKPAVQSWAMQCYHDRCDRGRGQVPAQFVFALISIQLSKNLEVHLPEQQNFIM